MVRHAAVCVLLDYHLGVRRKDAGLYAALQAAPAELHSSGDREKGRRKWEATP
jgi:hypothetical protein